MRHTHWLIDHPASMWAENYRLREPVTEREARAAYRADHGLQRLPAGTRFYPASL
jgi:hypothetical protein